MTKNSTQSLVLNGQISRWHTFTSQQAINEATLQRILALAEEAIAARGAFTIVLAGGNTPKQVYELLRHAKADWSKWHVYHNDDRCLPADHPERNSLMARQAWLDHVAIPADQIHDIPAERGPVEGAAAYAKTLQGLGEFDLVLLGLGEDGHTASLFPGHTWDDSVDAFPVYNSPKPPAERVSISARRLSHTRAVIFLVTGAGKQEAVNNWRSGVAIPATVIKPANGVDVYVFGVALN
ncbi:6-phosphogluconolactonase [Methylovorus glucosotrophus]|uniref:6-phosphogluconolactonase n=1 Tax=Methylovorus glucosotrophus (strain SIP3-4) TaxID=582744 RepID=C6XCR7_METGS|nr:6-phosphogluconolactonase [Methylovorus glucosotrophus]ACT50342.1 6-phosphogluconolactonase [Methylovorus glucosotrophus SIP3-4]